MISLSPRERTLAGNCTRNREVETLHDIYFTTRVILLPRLALGPQWFEATHASVHHRSMEIIVTPSTWTAANALAGTRTLTLRLRTATH